MAQFVVLTENTSSLRFRVSNYQPEWVQVFDLLGGLFKVKIHGGELGLKIQRKCLERVLDIYRSDCLARRPSSLCSLEKARTVEQEW